MGDITRIKEVITKEDGDWEEWPYPTKETTSQITGELREKILKKLNKDDGEVLIVETYESEGYSEFTQEDEYSIEVIVDAVTAHLIQYQYSSESVMAEFLRWVA